MLNKKKDFLTIKDYDKETIESIIEKAKDIKKQPGKYSDSLSGKNIALLFDKQSTRTRVSFESGINQLGASCFVLDGSSLQISRGETIGDTAKVLSRYLDGLVIRTFGHDRVEGFAKYSTIPVINGLTDSYHPCQALSDIFTLQEIGMLDKEMKFTYIGDCNNVANSLILGFLTLGIDITLGCPKEYGPTAKMLEISGRLSEKNGAKLIVINDAEESIKGADVIYTDVWVSMGDKESGSKIKALESFQINKKLLKHASDHVKVMHCLPAHRGSEITSEVLDDPGHSIVWDQAENRLHAQKSLLLYLFS
jgi:ornithine carbamoyltransferase